jgi:ABC-type polar amino acid transport system ATPase subunit
MSHPLISVRGLNRRYGAVHALVDVDLDVQPGEVVSIIGPSGSGKSTLIRCLNGLETPTSGSIAIDGSAIGLNDHKAWTRIRPDVGMVFQDYALFPHMTVLRNMTLAPVRRGRGSRRRKRPRWNCWPWSGLPTRRMSIRPSFPAGSSSGSRSCARWR